MPKSEDQRPRSVAGGPPAVWPARWITFPFATRRPMGVYHFRHTFDLPAGFSGAAIIHVTGDNRYQLFVNGARISWGPARGDMDHWRYESVDVAPHLRPGKNTLAAVVWFYGDFAGWNQMGYQPGFLLHAENPALKAMDTPGGWRALRSSAYEPVPLNGAESLGYSVCEACERLDASKHPWGWEQPGFDDSMWQPAAVLGPGGPRGARDGPPPYQLVPRPIPFMEETQVSVGAVVRTQGAEAANHRITPDSPSTVPANSKAAILIDHGALTTAYPALSVTGGAGALIRLRYAEALWDGRAKGNRNRIEGKVCRGFHDEYVTDGAARTFRPLYWRTFRFLQVEVETRDSPVTLRNLTCDYTGYPFQQRGRFASSDPELARLWEVGWRTARLCAHEHYMDCPYYEQLQYGGDTRIQCLVSLYVAGDDRLMRNAIRQLDDSRVPDGLTRSRYPCRLPQMIPPFALWWVEMLHDFWMFRDDPGFVRELLPHTRGVFEWFERHVRPDGLLGPLEWWNFVDWVRAPGWSSGVPPGANEGGSAVLSLQLSMTLQRAAEMEDALGRRDQATHYRRISARLNQAVIRLCWDAARELIADTPEKALFSHHANALGILSGALTGAHASAVAERILPSAALPPSHRVRTPPPASDAGKLAQATYYFRFYLHRALRRAGLGDRYLEWLGPWRDMLAIGLTTWAEEPEPTRSDCHAWSAHPNVDLLAIVLGIEPAAPGFARVRIEPHLGTLLYAEGAVPHPRGEIHARFERTGPALMADITLPPDTPGVLHHAGRSFRVAPGQTTRLRLEG